MQRIALSTVNEGAVENDESPRNGSSQHLFFLSLTENSEA